MVHKPVPPKMVQIANAIRSSLPALLGDRINVFLIGKSVQDPTSMRKKVLDSLSRWSKVRVYYPEDMFMELIYSRNLDLLELETLLAKSVHAVVMCVESWGSAAELGAFANHKQLRDRLVVITDSNYSKDKSFINLGPIRHVKKSKASRVISHNFKTPLGEYFPKALRTAIRRVAAKTHLSHKLSNIVVAEAFILAAVSVMGPVAWEELLALVTMLEPSEAVRASVVCSSALSSLFKQRGVLLQHGRYEITAKGRTMLSSVGLWDSKMTDLFDELRVDMLNLRLRVGYRFGERVGIS